MRLLNALQVLRDMWRAFAKTHQSNDTRALLSLPSSQVPPTAFSKETLLISGLRLSVLVAFGRLKCCSKKSWRNWTSTMTATFLHMFAPPSRIRLSSTSSVHPRLAERVSAGFEILYHTIATISAMELDMETGWNKKCHANKGNT